MQHDATCCDTLQHAATHLINVTWCIGTWVICVSHTHTHVHIMHGPFATRRFWHLNMSQILTHQNRPVFFRAVQKYIPFLCGRFNNCHIRAMAHALHVDSDTLMCHVCVAVCGRVLQILTLYRYVHVDSKTLISSIFYTEYSVVLMPWRFWHFNVPHVCCNVLQCVAVCCSVWQRVADCDALKSCMRHHLAAGWLTTERMSCRARVT